jgi:cytochrome bd-type quinol oxidase subunit 1
MMQVPLTLWLFWTLAAAAVIGAILCAIFRRWNFVTILTRREWSAAFQLVAILGMILAIIYFQNGHFSDQAAFIYGRF